MHWNLKYLLHCHVTYGHDELNKETKKKKNSNTMHLMTWNWNLKCFPHCHVGMMYWTRRQRRKEIQTWYTWNCINIKKTITNNLFNYKKVKKNPVWYQVNIQKGCFWVNWIAASNSFWDEPDALSEEKRILSWISRLLATRVSNRGGF